MHYILPILTILIFFGFGCSAAYAHTSVQVEQYEIEVGWDVEPPVVGFRNAIVYEISESPAISLSNVDLPDPLMPIRAMRSRRES